MANNTVASVSFKFSNQALATMETRIKEGMFKMGYDMAKVARRNAPVDTSALRNSIRVEPENNVVYVRAGGIVSTGYKNGVKITRYVDYALKNEREHRTKRFYMKRAQEEIMQPGFMTKYFKGVTK